MTQGVTNETSYFQGTLESTLGDFVRRICLVYMYIVIIWGRNVRELKDHFSWAVKKLMEVGLFVAAHKVTLYARGSVMVSRTLRRVCGRTLSVFVDWSRNVGQRLLVS